jgi:hypothetical protein
MPDAIDPLRRFLAMRIRHLAAALIPFAVAGCPRDKQEDEPLTLGEATQAVEEATLSSQASTLTSNSIEIATNFTIGQAVQDAAAELREFIATQLPCAEITLEGGTLSVEYGAKPGNCSYNGHNFSGTTTVTISRNDEGNVVVEHTWDDLSNGIVSVTGDATVTWDFDGGTRHVVHTATWTRVSDGRTGTGAGDRTQSLLDGGLAEGIRVDGTRTWDGKSGHWELAIDGVEIRWQDPVPQAGSYVLATPFGKSASLSFLRVDGDTIQVTVTNGRREFKFDVTSLGAVSES